MCSWFGELFIAYGVVVSSLVVMNHSGLDCNFLIRNIHCHMRVTCPGAVWPYRVMVMVGHYPDQECLHDHWSTHIYCLNTYNSHCFHFPLNWGVYVGLKLDKTSSGGGVCAMPPQLSRAINKGPQQQFDNTHHETIHCTIIMGWVGLGDSLASLHLSLSSS